MAVAKTCVYGTDLHMSRPNLVTQATCNNYLICIRRLMENARHLGSTIKFNDTIISKDSVFDNIIKVKSLGEDVKTLVIFLEAMRTHEKCAWNSYAYIDKGLKIHYEYELDLGKVLQEEVDALLVSNDRKASLNLLREIGAEKRVYDPPNHLFLPSNCYGWRQEDVDRLAESWLGEPIKNALTANVRLQYNIYPHKYPISKSADLAKMILEDQHLEEETRTLLLFRAALHSAAVIACRDREKPLQYVLDLRLLTPKHLTEAFLKSKNITNKHIEDFIDDPEKYPDFLIEIGVLRTETIA